MRSSDGTYHIANERFESLTELKLLVHYQAASMPSAAEIYRLRVQHLTCNHAELLYQQLTANDTVIVVQQRQHGIFVKDQSGACDSSSLTDAEFIALKAIMQISSYRVFFDAERRRETILPYAKPYGLEQESNLDAYFTLSYDKGNIGVTPVNDAILRVDSMQAGSSIIPVPVQTERFSALNDETSQTIIVLSEHRFYSQLRFALMQVQTTKSGKPKAPFTALDATSALWKAQDAASTKFYAAINTFAQGYEEQDPEVALEALLAIQRNPLKFPVYCHDRDQSDHIHAKSISAVQLTVLDATLLVRVFKRSPFYEITASLRWGDQVLAVKTLPIRHRYFLKKETQYHLISNIHLLNVITYFRKSADILLVHESKYEAFSASVLNPLEDIIDIQYASIRAANVEEQKAVLDDMERMVYLTQRGDFIHLTPVMRYGNTEIPLVSRKSIKRQDQNGNFYQVTRDLVAEDKFKNLLMQRHPYFAEQVSERDYFYLHHRKFFSDDWFLSAFDRLRQEGVHVLGTQNINFGNRNTHQPKIDIKILSGKDWFNVQINTAFGEQQVSVKQLYRSLKNKGKFITLDDGTKGVLPQAWLDKLSRYITLAELKDDLLIIPKTRFAGLAELTEASLAGDATEKLQLYKERLTDPDRLPAFAVPYGLNATLRPYQIAGVRWLANLDDLDFGGCLADDMGLGKTLQIITLLLLQREKQPQRTTLILMPTSLLFNWQQEIARFAPFLRVHLFYEKGRELPLAQWAAHDILLTTYGTMLSELPKLRKFTFDTIILDETQNIKNPASSRYKAAMQLQARNRFVLSGTPVENSTYDLYGQLSFACPGLLGNTTYFRDTYATPIDRFEDTNRAAELQRFVAPFILRRTKKQVAQELPEKTDMMIYCELGDTQRAIYDTYEAEFRDYLQAVEEDDLERHSMHILAGLTRLRQISNAPALLKAGYSSATSAKIDAMLEQLDSIVGNHKVLIFSQFVEMLSLIQERLEERGLAFSLLTGQTKDREAAVARFQENDAVRVFLISLKAGGVGLNLTAADYVFIMDPWWNPAVENQAIDRTYRIGQEKHVVAVRFIALNTVEQKIVALQDKKRELVGKLIATGGSITAGLGKDSLLSLLD